MAKKVVTGTDKAVVEDTTIGEDTKAQIEEMVKRAVENATEPGTLKPGDVVHKGDEEVPVPMVASELKSAGYVYIYDTKTFERSLTNKNMLSTQLGKKRPDGSFVFTTVRPKVGPTRGTKKCMLHAEDPNRGHYDELGFGVCRKSNLTSPFQVRRHMQRRHKMEWEAIEEERKTNEARATRELQEALLRKAL